MMLLGQRNTPLKARATKGRGSKARRALVVVIGVLIVTAILSLTKNVSREIELLGSAKSDNVQWSLAQTQVEYLEFAQQVEREPVDLSRLREEFDVFYSRMSTVAKASVFAPVRADPAFKTHLADIRDFLNDSVPLIDASDEVLLAGLPALADETRKIQMTVRALGASGLEQFALSADEQRATVARTMIELAIALAGLIAVLAITVLYLNRLNRRIYRRERDQKQTADRMNTVISTSLDGVIISDDSGHILEFNPAAEAMFGYKQADVIGREIGSVIVPDHMRAMHDAGMERMRVKGEKRVVGKGRVKLEAKRANGEIFPVELAIQSATTNQGEVFIAFLRDISQRVAAEAELVSARDRALASEKTKTDFLATMSHEIRTPLNGLLGNMSLLRDTKLTPNQDRYVGYMETSGRLLMSHISDVLDITRYDAGKLSTRSEPMNISALLQDIVDNQSSTAAKNETSLSWYWQGPEVGWISSDHDRLQHVMMNLIGNAVKFTRRGAVSVTVENTSHTADLAELMIRISDTGPGMSEDLAKHVFDDFVTGNTAYDRDVGGTGLGLSIAKRFVHALGGDIGVESTLGQGSTFWVTLPVERAQEPAQAALDADASWTHNRLTILVVEDNEINRIVAREMLQAEGHHVVEVTDGKQGAEIAKSRHFDLILMDISMPIMDGRTATRRIRREGGASSTSKIIALTANAVAEEQAQFIADGMDGILTKPLSRDALRTLLQTSRPASRLSEPSFVDHAHSAETREAVGEETFAKLRSRFVSEVEDLLVWLGSAGDLDFLEVAARAHKVAGSAAVFGTKQMRDTLKELEVAAKAGEGAAMIGILSELDTIWRRTKADLVSS